MTMSQQSQDGVRSMEGGSRGAQLLHSLTDQTPPRLVTPDTPGASKVEFYLYSPLVNSMEPQRADLCSLLAAEL